MDSERRFYDPQGQLDPELVEVWAEAFYQGLMKMMNGFYGRADMAEVLASMRNVPFNLLTARELEGEAAEIIELALDYVNAIAAREIEYLQAYLGKL